jgi:hypothetical protein
MVTIAAWALVSAVDSDENATSDSVRILVDTFV